MGDIKYILEDSQKVFKGGVRKEDAGNIFGYILGTILMFLPLFMTVYIKAQLTANGYKISKLFRELEILRDEKMQAEAELMMIENPKYLYGIAKKMGFDYPDIERMNGNNPK